MCAFLWTVLFALAGPLSNTAHAQTFEISLDDLGVLYDELFPERTQRAVWDTTGTIDLSTVAIGNQSYRVRHFLTHDVEMDRTLVEYGAITGFRVTYRIPRTYAFASHDSTVGEYIVQTPRDHTIPGLEVEIEPLDSVVSEIRRESLRAVWRETAIAAILAQRGTAAAARTGVTIPIPLPMPKQLESIFGPSEKTHINITGREEITFAGETRRVSPYIGIEGREKQSLFPALDMKQTLDVRLTGTIGDKVNVQVDHSSEALTDDANRIRLNYTGYEDDVIQLIELGNTSLSLPGSQLVSFSTQSKGLFGVKVLAQLGSTDLTVIASKQQGETSSASFSPAAGAIGTTERVARRDIDYVKDTYFFFNHPSVAQYEFDPELGRVADALLPDQAPGIDIYREVKPSDKIADPELASFGGRAFVDAGGTGSDINAAIAPLASGLFPDAQLGVKGEFELLTLGEDYVFVLDAVTLDPIGFELVRPITETEVRAIAVAYTNRAGQRVGGQNYNSVLPPGQQLPAEQDTLVLELIKDRSPRPTGQYGFLWDYMMRNIYNLGLSNIDATSFRLEIEDNLDPSRLNATTPDTLDVPYIRIFGLDRFDESGQAGSDGRVDLRSGVVDLQRGTVTFPSLRPFAPPDDSVKAWTNDQFSFLETNNGQFEAQYDTSSAIYERFISQTDIEKYHQYTIAVEAVSTTKTFRIDALNVIENSEVVTLDGNRLTRGTDYRIDYETGEVELMGSVLNELTPASKIDIDYEYKPFGGGGSSSLVGFNTQSLIGQDARLGMTWLYESKNVSAGKPRVGEEPTRAMVGGVNGSIQHESRFLTDLVNMLPLVDTDAPSSVNVNGEVAMSIPDPNTRGEAYIDDFEGVEDSDRISMSRRSWYRASPPVVNEPGGTTFTFPDTSRWDFIWYNIESQVAPHKRDLNPDLDDKENTVVPALDIELDPTLPADTDTTAWVGVITGFGGGGLDLTQGQFVELWVNDFKPDRADRGGQLRIDFGNIDEDFFEPEKNELDDEDYGRDGFAAAYDDTGLDGLFNCCDPNPNRTGADTEGGANEDDDRNGDDIDLSRINGRFEKVNGTEGNLAYDTEDLDRSGQLDAFNAYYSFVINLADSAVVDIRDQYPGYDGFTGDHSNDTWRLYRIRLSDAVVVSPTGAAPQIDQVRHMRVWFNNVLDVVPTADGPGKRRLQIAELKILGNRWQEDGVRDLQDREVSTAATEFAIGVISTKTDPGVYDPPVRPNVTNEVADKETSLFLRYDTLEDSTQIRIFKRFSGNGLDLTLYSDLHFWVHTDAFDDSLEYYFRLGTNETNFYEIVLPLSPAYFTGTRWSRVIIDLADLSDLKFAPADSAVYGVASDLVEDRTYPIKMVGSPSLFSVRFLYAGVRNTSTTGEVHSGELWINDILVGSVKRDIDFAERASAALTLGGGVLSLSGGWTRTGPDFRGLRQRRGGGSINEAYNVTGKTNVLHFIPLGGFSIPLSGSYRRSTSRPKFVPNSDTEITDAALQDSLETVVVNKGFSTALDKKGSKNPLLKYTIDKVSTNFSYNKTEQLAPASADTTTSMTGTLGYQITWQGSHALRLGKDTSFRYWPNSFDIRTSASRRTSRHWRFIGSDYKPDPFQFTAALQNAGSVNYSPFKSVTSSFKMSIDRDVRLPHEWLGVDVGTEVRRGHSLQVTYRPPPTWRVVKDLAPDFGFSTGYGEDASPNIRNPGDPPGVRNVNASRAASAKMRFDVGQVFAKTFKKLGMDIGSEKQPRHGGPQPQPSAEEPPPGEGGFVVPDTSAAGTGDEASVPPEEPEAAAPADTTRAPGAKSDPMFGVRKLAEVLTQIRKVNVNVQHRVGNSYSRIPDRPSTLYQLGFAQSTGVASGAGEFDEPERSSANLNLSADTGVQLSDDIDVAARYSRTIADTDFRQNRQRSLSTNFPDFQLSWKGLEKLPILRPVFTQTQANVNFKKFKQEAGLRDAEPDNVRETLSLAPSLLFTWKNDMKSTLGVSYNKNTQDTRGAKSETTNLSVNVDFKKTFSGGSGFKLPIPLLRKEFKWKSQLDSNLSIAYARTGGKRFAQGSDISQPIPGTTSIRVSPNVAYHFSQTLSGRAFIDYDRSYNEATNQTVTTVRLGVTAVFTF